MRLDPEKLKLYVILDPNFCALDPLDVAKAVLDAGVCAIQWRDKSHERSDVAGRLTSLCGEYGALYIVNDSVQLALDVGAHGVHVGPNDTPVAEVRRLAPDLLVGTSCGTVEAVERAIEDGADYVGVGAIFEAREVKPDASAPRGLAIIDAVSTLAIPVVGIGGITAKNAPEVWRAGAAGVAVIRAVCGSDEPAAAVAEFIR